MTATAEAAPVDRSTAGELGDDAGRPGPVRGAGSPVLTEAVIQVASSLVATPVAGLPLLRRLVLAAERAEFDRVSVLAGKDVASCARALLDADPRTRHVPVLPESNGLPPPDGRTVVLSGECFLPLETMRRVRQDLLAGADGRRCRHLPGIEDKSEPGHDPIPCLSIGSRADAARAEDVLVAGLRAETSDTDGPIARFDRAVSTRLSLLLVRTFLRPNHITTIGTLIGLAAAWCFARGSYGAGIAGALLFWLAVIVDGCDGEVARLTFRESRLGRLYDITTDNVVHVAIFLGLGIGYFRAHPAQHATGFVTLLVGGFLCAMAASLLLLYRSPPSRNVVPRTWRGRWRRRVLAVLEAMMNRDFAYLLVPLAAANLLGWFLWGAAFGTYLYAIVLLWAVRWSDAA